jgi:hypothetical protein
MAEWVWVVFEKMIWVFGGSQTFLCSFTGTGLTKGWEPLLYSMMRINML